MAEAISVPPGLVERMTRFAANCRWATAHDHELQQYLWRYVAIDDERLLDVADTWQELRERYADRDALYLTQVSPPDMAWMFHGQS